MDRLILTRIPECKEHEGLPVLPSSYELNPRYKYEVWFNFDLNKWVVTPLKTERQGVE